MKINYHRFLICAVLSASSIAKPKFLHFLCKLQKLGRKIVKFAHFFFQFAYQAIFVAAMTMLREGIPWLKSYATTVTYI